jgi:hypothetical protein
VAPHAASTGLCGPTVLAMKALLLEGLPVATSAEVIDLATYKEKRLTEHRELPLKHSDAILDAPGRRQEILHRYAERCVESTVEGFPDLLFAAHAPILSRLASRIKRRLQRTATCHRRFLLDSGVVQCPRRKQALTWRHLASCCTAGGRAAATAPNSRFTLASLAACEPSIKTSVTRSARR